MIDEESYLGRCSAAYRKIMKKGIGSADPLLQFSILRLAKVAMNAEDPSAEWSEIYTRCQAQIETVPRQAPGETAGLDWPIHPGAAWMAARGNEAYVKPFLEAAEKLVENGHRNGDGLFDDPKYPGHLSTEIAAMTIPALAWAGACGKDERFFDEAIRQFEGYMAALYDPAARLWHPGYLPGRASAEMWPVRDKTPQSQVLYLKHTGRFPGCWGRGEGYALFALSELVFELPDGHPKKAELLKVTEIFGGIQINLECFLESEAFNPFTAYCLHDKLSRFRRQFAASVPVLCFYLQRDILSHDSFCFCCHGCSRVDYLVFSVDKASETPVAIGSSLKDFWG